MIELDTPEQARALLIARLEAHKDEFAQTLLDVYRRELGAFMDMENAEQLRGVRRAVRASVRFMLEAITLDGRLPRSAFARHEDLGRQWAAQGVPLHAMVTGVQITTKVACEFVMREAGRTEAPPDAAAELAARTCLVLLDCSTRLSSAISEMYRQAEQDLSATKERLRREVFDELLDGPTSDMATLLTRARATGFRLAAAHAVVIVTVEGLGTLDSPFAESARRRTLEAVRNGFGNLPPVMVQERDNLDVAILPLQDGGRADLLKLLESAIGAAVPEGLPWFASVGRVEQGVSGIAASYRQALRAHEAARTLGLLGRAVPYEEMLPVLLLMKDRALADDILRTTVAPLMRYDEKRETRLVETLEVLLQEQGNALAAAKALFVHRHTLIARIKRIEQLTGRSVRNGSDVLLFELGLLARHALPPSRRRA